VKPLSKIFNTRGILFSLLASLFARLEFAGKVFSPFVRRKERICRKDTGQKLELHKDKGSFLGNTKDRSSDNIPFNPSQVLRYPINWAPRLMKGFIRGYSKRNGKKG
jgi:hypothetical protein